LTIVVISGYIVDVAEHQDLIGTHELTIDSLIELNMGLMQEIISLRQDFTCNCRESHPSPVTLKDSFIEGSREKMKINSILQ
jgi:hypothetical protein